MPHISLLGDSIFDNAAYIDGGADVLTHLQRQLPAGWYASLHALDGSFIEDVSAQLADLSSKTTHLIVSAGGNDVLQHQSLLDAPATSTAAAFIQLAEAVTAFRNRYRRMLGALAAQQLPTATCTIYNPCYPEPQWQQLASTALAAFNDAIVQEAVAAGIPLLDLRAICTEPEDYANPIEPSSQGGGTKLQPASSIWSKPTPLRGRPPFTLSTTAAVCVWNYR